MKNIAYYLGFAGSLILLTGSCSTDSNNAGPWPEITKEAKPWTRWWWMGSAIDRENISSLMEEYSAAGFGGVEIAPIYGVKGREDLYLEFLSPAWMDMLKTSVSEAENNGMGLDMTLGTGWPFGGPQITPEYAASRLIYKKYELSGNESLEEKIVPDDPRQVELGANLEALMAYSISGEILNLTQHVAEDGTLDWTPESGEWELYAAFCGKTRQKVKRAAPGGEGYTLNHFSKPALDTYLKRFDDSFAGYSGVRSFFNDSYEVYGASWSPRFFDEFLTRRGYDLREYLRELTAEEGGDEIARLKSDYRETMSELLLENFTIPWAEWSHSRGSLSRNQAHGSPGNLIDLYAVVDIPECEIFGHSSFDIPGLRRDSDDTKNVEPNPMMLKLATSAAHVTNKPRISNETFTWLGEHFKVALSQCKPEVEQAFLAGINHVFYHGMTYSPADAPWPGWLFYASVNFAPSNSFWPHLSGLNKYIARCQSVLQSGKPDNEILVYWPIYDIWDNPERLEMQLTVHNIREWLVYPGLEQMTERGYSFDFISDALLAGVDQNNGLLETAEGTMSYEVLVIPECDLMPLESLQKAIDLANSGSLVIFQKMPGDVPGLNELETRRQQFNAAIDGLHFTELSMGIQECKTGKGSILLAENIEKALEYSGIHGERISEYGLQFTRRTVKDGKYYYLVNHTSASIDTMISLNVSAESVLIMDPQDGTFGKAFMVPVENQTRVRVQLQSGESVFLRTYNSRFFEGNDWAYEERRAGPIKLQGSWELEFVSGGPELPGTAELEMPLPWTELGDTSMQNFSGTAEYRLRFNQPDIPADEYILDLGQIYESARVNLNGNDLGVLWCIPYEVKIGEYIKEGENTLKIEVANLMANRIRYMDRNDLAWRKFHEINFVNILYKPFDASGWEIMKSGLRGPVQIIPIYTSSD
ncbi:glycosyl hydrolase [Bacteroidota bacterium]